MMLVSRSLVLTLVLLAPRLALSATPDPWITTKVKIALVTAEVLAGLSVDVDTVDGQVTLHGKTPSAEARAKAEEIARSVEGVRKLRNLLQVIPENRTEKTELTDQWLERELGQKLAGFADGRIQLASVHDGVALLSGEAESSAEHLRAIDLVKRVRGVRRVASEVRTAANDAELDVWNGHELRQDGKSLADVASDIWTTAEVRLALYSNDDIPSSDIAVDTRMGDVTLFGTVATDDEKAEAEDEAEDVGGVGRVRNLLQVVPAQRQEEVKKSDADLQQRVAEAIFARPELKGATVRADVRKRLARLTGTVPTQRHRVIAAAAARRVSGIRAVNTEGLRVMSITQSATSAATPRGKPRKPSE